MNAERLRDLLSYDPDNGVFRWKVSRGPVRAGSVAGCPDGDGYLCFCVDRRLYRAHRLAWLYTYGVWPVHQLDHIDGNRTNNAINNLRQATPSQNQHNRGAPSNNKSGFKGVCWKNEKRKWRAEISANGKRVHLGYFETAQAAHDAYNVAAAVQHREFARSA